MCRAPLHYTTTSGVCLMELSGILTFSNCLSNSEGNVLVEKNNETTATNILNKLNSIRASAECRRKAVPFLCLHLFGLCVESGVSIQPTAGQCEEIRDITCQDEWVIIASDLPDCVTFPSESALSCIPLNNSYTSDVTIAGDTSGKL